MIIKAFSKELQNLNSDTPSVILLSVWIKKILTKKPKNNVEKIVHKEIYLSQNEFGYFLLIGKSKTGKTLIKALYNFALSFDAFKFSRWIHNKKASDFNKD